MGCRVCSKRGNRKEVPCSPGHGTGKRSDLAEPSGGSKCRAAPTMFRDETQPVQRQWRAGYTADPPRGVQVEKREAEGRTGTASLLAPAPNLSASPQPDSHSLMSASCSLSKSGRLFIILGFNSKNPGTGGPAEFAQN